MELGFYPAYVSVLSFLMVCCGLALLFATHNDDPEEIKFYAAVIIILSLSMIVGTVFGSLVV